MENSPVPTLEAYYQLLPDEVKNRPMVLSTYLFLEKKAHYISL